MPKISIVMPVYNVEKYLRECLDSVRAQTFTDWECICVDDGSTDASPAVLDEYAAKDPRFKVIKREHSNAGACRNVGMTKATGEFLLFLDSDDVFSNKLLFELISLGEDSESDVAICGWVNVSSTGKIAKWKLSTKTENSVVVRNPADQVYFFGNFAGAQPWNKLFSREFINRNALRFQEIQSFNDLRFSYMALSLASSIARTPLRLVAYRRRINTLHSGKTMGIDCGFQAYDSYVAEMELRGMFGIHPQLLRNFKQHFAFAMAGYLDRMETFETLSKTFKAIQKRAVRWSLDSLKPSDFPENAEVYERVIRWTRGCSLEEELWEIKRALQARSDKKLQGILSSLDYRLGHALLSIPRRLARIAWKTIGR